MPAEARSASVFFFFFAWGAAVGSAVVGREEGTGVGADDGLVEGVAVVGARLVDGAALGAAVVGRGVGRKVSVGAAVGAAVVGAAVAHDSATSTHCDPLERWNVSPFVALSNPRMCSSSKLSSLSYLSLSKQCTAMVADRDTHPMWRSSFQFGWSSSFLVLVVFS